MIYLFWFILELSIGKSIDMHIWQTMWPVKLLDCFWLQKYKCRLDSSLLPSLIPRKAQVTQKKLWEGNWGGGGRGRDVGVAEQTNSKVSQMQLAMHNWILLLIFSHLFTYLFIYLPFSHSFSLPCCCCCCLCLSMQPSLGLSVCLFVCSLWVLWPLHKLIKRTANWPGVSFCSPVASHTHVRIQPKGVCRVGGEWGYAGQINKY